MLTTLFHGLIFLNFCSNISWLFAFSYLQFWVAFALLVNNFFFKLSADEDFKNFIIFKLLITFSLYAALVISHRNIYNSEKQLKETPVYLWLYRILVNNGLAYYATWVTLASLLNFAIALTYSSGGNLR